MENKTMEDKKIVVFYVSVSNMDDSDIPEYMHKLSERLTPRTVLGEIIFIPVQGYDTRVECINPKYITDSDLIRENEKLMVELKHEMQKQLEIMKEQKTNDNEEN